MRSRGKHWRIKILAGGLLAATILLACLQYYWTGELSRAEEERSRARLQARIEAFAANFDRDLARAMRDFLPEWTEVQAKGWQVAHQEAALRAFQNGSTAWFRRIAFAVPTEGGQLQLRVWSPEQRAWLNADWPTEWSRTRAGMEEILRGARFPGSLVELNSTLVEVPLLEEGRQSGPGHAGPREKEWLLAELDLDRLRERKFPELSRAHLNPGLTSDILLRIRKNTPARELVYSSEEAQALPDAAEAQVRLFPVRMVDGPPGPPLHPEPKGPPGKKKKNGRSEVPQRWTLEAWPAGESIAAAAGAARWKNLAASSLLLLLMAIAAGLLVRESQRARESAESQFRFLAAMSHELRTPLTVIQGAAHNLLSGVVQNEAQKNKYLGVIERNAGQLKEMVEQVLSYAKTQNGPSEELELSSLSVALSEAMDLCAPDLEASHTQVELEIPPQLPELWIRSAHLRRVLQNLLSNAAKHGGRSIRIHAGETSAGGVLIEVADDGEGIPTEEINRVFEPFYRGERALSSQTRGTGLGLSVVRELVEAVGGKVSAESKPGAGTTFRIELRGQGHSA